MSITGSKGRLEAAEFQSGYQAVEPFQRIRVFDMAGNITTHEVKKQSGLHGGGDVRLRRILFGDGDEGNLDLMADSIEGAKSLLIGACANLSIKQNKKITISEEIVL